MTERLSTSAASDSSEAFAATDIFHVQVQAADTTTKFTVSGRVSTDAPWAEIGVLDMADPIARFAPLPYVQISVAGNKPGNAARAWSSV